jgi:ribosomal-protein-alanine N-acetyltransferase
MLEADRLVIYAASEDEMNKILAEEADEHLRAAYGEMLRGSLDHPEDWGWYALWLIVRKDGACIGNLSFKGVPEDGVVELGYGISEEYRGYGYATEAVETILAWAFDQPGVTSVAAETEAGNAASRRVLEKCGFLPAGEGKEGPRFVRDSDSYGGFDDFGDDLDSYI